MAQIRKGLIRLTQGATTVRHVWTAIFTSVTGGPFGAVEQVTWAGGGVGVTTSYDAAAKRLRFVRTAGPAPTVGTVLTGGTSGAVATIAEMSEHDPPSFDTLIPTGQTVILAVSGASAPYFLTGTPGPDYFVLSAAWATASLDEATYGLQTAYTARGLPIIESGDVGAALIVSYGFAMLETLDARYVQVQRTTNVALGASGNVDLDEAVEDDDGWLQAGGALLVPAGVSLVEVTVGIQLASLDGGDLWRFTLTKNGTGYDGQPWVSGFCDGTVATWDGGFSSGPIPVAEDDQLRLAYLTSGSPVLDIASVKLRVLA